MIRYEVVFSGHVQGVFFRATTERIAHDFDVSGWVRNEPNGTVRCVAEGDEDELERFVEAIRRAKRPNIAAVDVSRSAATGEFAGFAVTG